MGWFPESATASCGSECYLSIWLAHFHFSLSCTGEGNGNPLQCSCLENPGMGEPGGLPSMGLHRVRHDWSDLAAAAALVHLYTISHYSILLWKFQFFRVRNRGFSSGYVADPQSKWWAQWLDSGHLTWKPELDTVSRAHRWGWWYFMVRTSRRNWDQLLYLVLHSPFYWGFYSNPLS